jgi:hypothetical protein
VNTFLTGALNTYNQTISTLYAGSAYIITGTMYTTRIQANSSTTPFTICDNLTTGTLSIGSATTTTTILGTLLADNIQGSNVSVAMVMGTNLSGGSLTIGSSNASTLFNSYPKIISGPLLSTDNSSSIPTTSWVKTNFGGLTSTNVWSSNQAFGSYIQTGDLLALYIAPITLYGNTSSTLSIGSNCSSITIGGNQTSGAVTIGSLTSTTRILGTTNASVLNSSTARFESVDSNATTLNIGTTNATTINMGKSNTEVNIATSSSRSAILDLGNGASSTGAVLINNGSGSSGDTQIMNATTQSGNLTLGNASNTVTIALNRPLTPGYTYSTTGTGSGKVGEIIKVAQFGVWVGAGTPTSLTFIDVPAGVWYLQGSCGTAGNGSGYNFLGFSTVNNSLQFLGSTNNGITSEKNGFDSSSFLIKMLK